MADPKGSAGARKGRAGKVGEAVKPSLGLTRKNLYLMVLAASSVVLGFVLLAAHALDLGAFFLVAGYLVLFPVAIMVK